MKSSGDEILPQHLSEPVISILIEVLVEDRKVPHLRVKYFRREICTPEDLLERLPVGTHYVPEPGMLVGVRNLSALGERNYEDQPRHTVYD